MTLVSIREYYSNDAGELRPGKKVRCSLSKWSILVFITNQGIALSLDQYNAFLTAAPLLESVLSKKDIQVVRPVYDADLTAAKPEDEQDGEPPAVTNVDKDEDEDEEKE